MCSPNIGKPQSNQPTLSLKGIVVMEVFFLVLIMTGLIVALILVCIREIKLTPEQRARRTLRRLKARGSHNYGSNSPAMICPHCQTKGTVRTEWITQKKGISGGKATSAILTGGLSLLATGLSRKEDHIEAHCNNCGMTWVI